MRTADLTNCLGRPFTTNPSQSFTFKGVVYQERGYAGHYGGLTAVPSRTQVTSAGIEAQCLFGAGLSEDGMPGPQSWRWLRWWEQ